MNNLTVKDVFSKWSPQSWEVNEKPYAIHNIKDPDSLDVNQTFIILRIEKDNIDFCVNMLRKMKKIRFLLVSGSFANMKIIECISKMHSLERLIIDVRRADDFSPLSKLTNLTHLWVTPIKQVETLKCLTALNKLEALQIELTKSVSNLDFIKRCTWPELKVLFLFSNSDSTLLNLDSMSPLTHLEKLIMLRLVQVKCSDNNLDWVLNMPMLKFLTLGSLRRWDKESYIKVQKADLEIID